MTVENMDEARAEIRRLKLRVNGLLADKKRLEVMVDALKLKQASSPASFFDNFFGPKP